MSVIERDAEHRVRQRFLDDPLDFDQELDRIAKAKPFEESTL